MKETNFTLGALAIEKGLQTGPFGSQLKAEEYTDDGIPVVMPKDIYGGRIIETHIARIPDGKAIKLSKHRIKAGDIIFPRRGDLGRIGVASEKNEGWLCGTGCLRARLKDGIDPRYIHQYLQLVSVKNWLESHALGQTMLNLNTEIIHDLPIYLPAISEQCKIAELLDVWDTAIEKTEKMIVVGQKRFKWFLLQYLSGKRRIGASLKKWTNIPFNEIFEPYKIENKANEDLALLSVTKDGIVRQSDYFNKNVASEDKSNYLIAERGSLVMSGLNFWMGSIDFQTICDAGIVSPAYKVFRIINLNVVPDYMHYLVRSPFMTRILINSSVQGASIVRRNLDVNYLNESPIFLPPVEEQKEIAARLKSIDTEIQIEKKLLEAYRKQKKGLMQKLLTGQWQMQEIEGA